jgi:hypothetical protein
MGTERVITVVGTRCQPELEERFNAWYNGVHLPALFTYSGLTKITRYKLLPADLGAPLPMPAPWIASDINKGHAGSHPPYLAISEFESHEAYEAYERGDLLANERRAMKDIWKNGGWTLEWKVSYETVKTWKR